MAYPIEINYVSKNGYFTPAEAQSFYGHYSRSGIAVHWWNTPDKAGTHEQTVAYLAGQAAAGNVSANYVVSDGKITLLVSPDNVAWASGAGNASTISIEFDPRLSAEGYKRGGWLIKELEERYGKTLPLSPHSRWVATGCPGTTDLARLRREANKLKQGNASTPSKGGKKMWQDYSNKDALIREFYEIIRGSAPTKSEVQSHHRGSPVTTVQGFRKEMDVKRRTHDAQLAALRNEHNNTQKKLDVAQKKLTTLTHTETALATAKADIEKLEAQNSDLAARLSQEKPAVTSPLENILTALKNFFTKGKTP